MLLFQTTKYKNILKAIMEFVEMSAAKQLLLSDFLYIYFHAIL